MPDESNPDMQTYSLSAFEATSVLRGGYVQAWVWVGIEDMSTDVQANVVDVTSLTDAEFITLARGRYASEGYVEIDDFAKVSRSFDSTELDGC